MSPPNVLVTGGAGYIGSHTVLEMLNAGYNVICIDNLSNAYSSGSSKLPESLNRVQKLTGKTLIYYCIDITDRDQVRSVFQEHKIDMVAHFAALKAVGESCRIPLQYYHNNMTGTNVLLEAMADNNVFKFVYSSSATVYGEPKFLPVTEEHPTGNCTSPYGKTKYFTEEILKDLCKSDKRWAVMSLRYFNPVGAHPSGCIGEDPNGEPNNLMPFIAQVAVGRRDVLKIYGSDFPTKDGTGVRDYIHIVDLAEGHLRALEKLRNVAETGFFAYNLGTGVGYSVLEMVHAFEEASNRKINYEITDRRSGDVATCFANASLAEASLGWKAKRGIIEMCADTWRWQSNNPNGYASK
ncbi:UDP-glucose 4-epimerase [Bactrocera dorsalis]|uniref:UDP-glucose 4-epimerase n=2 Tax=Bactrocera TaxID=47832 RepID=A0A034W6A1_BACDO|nr:UDP-glucose 4-epimerase [Bactrocera dorsalis]XP_011214482.1 UDP-glucose 4-epimerase [Bactrocera dorsalis]XP_011214483.1 UDP-glucose 4-epimerase [Bactrocera dorsalis]XP_049314411.1 UDP-glucose 4-epimerase [Bactrocera dorsalis]XP_049314412.1 UDP-glucose 4-epimerase [Bactrocera dorsalis]